MTARLPGRIRLTCGPTPIEPVRGLGDELGIELYVRRDDLAGFAESGNKVRKLEFLVREALDPRADSRITVSCRAWCWAATRRAGGRG